MWDVIGRKLRRTRAAGQSPVDSRAGYSLWAGEYPPYAHNPLMEAEEEAMLSLLPPPAGKACLDLACGTGRYMRIVRERGARSAVGVDLSFDMLVHGRRHLPGLPVAQSPFLPLPFRDASFDVITCALAVAYERALRDLLREASRVLKPGGALVYSDRHPFRTLSGTPRHSLPGPGGGIEIEHHLHRFEDHVEACREAGLTIDRVREPEIRPADPTRPPSGPGILAIAAFKVSPPGRKSESPFSAYS